MSYVLRLTAHGSRLTAHVSRLTRSASRQVDPHALDLRVLFESVSPALTPEAGLLEAPEGKARLVEIVGIDPDGPGLQLLGRAQRLLHVSRPNGGGETVDRGVADRDGFRLVPEPKRREDGAEDFLPGNRHGRVDVIEDRRFEERAFSF